MLLAAGALFAAVTLLNNLIKAIARAPRVGFWDIALAYLAVLVTAAALVVDATGPTRDPLISPLALGVGAALAGVSLLTVLIELFRPERLRGSRGLLGLFSGVLVAFSSVFIPFAAVFIALELAAPEPAAVVARAGGPAATADADAASTETADSAANDTTGASEPGDDTAAQLFTAIRTVLADEIVADEADVFAQLDEGVPLSTIIEANGGDVERVVSRLSDILKTGVRESIDAGQTNAIQGAFVLSQMETFVRLAVTNNLNELGSRFGGPTPEGTRPSLLTLLTETPSSRAANATATAEAAATAGLPIPTERAATRIAAVPATAAATQPPTTAPTDAPTRTPAPTETTAPSETAAPRETPTPTRTRFTFQTATPLPTGTPVTPCIASVTNNLRLRAAPSAEAETLLVIPFSTTLLLDGRSLGVRAPGGPTPPPTVWYATGYEGQRGWVDGTFLQTAPGCATLPIIE